MEENSIAHTIKDCLEKLKGFIENPELEVKAYLSFLLNKDKSFFVANPEHQLTNNDLEKVKNFIERRIDGEPFAYITKEKEFYGSKFFVDNSVLIPRPETELLVEYSIKVINEFYKNNKTETEFSILELGTGSACIPISIINAVKEKQHNIKLISLEKSTSAFNTANKNLELYKLENQIEIINQDWNDFFEGNTKKFDLIISNPPYVEESEKHPSIIREPELALFSGSDGMDDIKDILKKSHTFLKSNGNMFIEIGKSQSLLIVEYLENNPETDLKVKETIKDLARLDRVVWITKK